MNKDQNINRSIVDWKKPERANRPCNLINRELFMGLDDPTFRSLFLGNSTQEFVCNAYASILKRKPDSDGLRHYMDALDNGSMGVFEVMGSLRFSPEGEVHKVKLTGLRFLYRIEKLRKKTWILKTLLGFPLKLLTPKHLYMRKSPDVFCS